GVQGGRLRHVVLVIRNEPEWWNVRHENVKGAGPPQLLDQTSHPHGGRTNVSGALVIKKIIPAAPDNVEGSRIHGVAGEVIVYLLAEVIDRDGEVAAEKWFGVRNNRPLAPARDRGRAAKGVIRAAIQVV